MDQDPHLQPFGPVPGLLRSKDDIHRFTGLAVLQQILDKKENLRNDEVIMTEIWEMIPKTFLIRLIKSAPTQNVSSPVAETYQNLAIAVAHKFICFLLPLSFHQIEELHITALSFPLIMKLPLLAAEQKKMAWEILNRIAGDQRQSRTMWAREFPNEFWLFKEDDDQYQEALGFLRLSRSSWGCKAPGNDIEKQIHYWSSAVVSLLQNSKCRAAPVFEMLTGVFEAKVVSLVAKPFDIN